MGQCRGRSLSRNKSKVLERAFGQTQSRLALTKAATL